MQVRAIHYVYILILAVVWGSSFTAVKAAVVEFTPLQIAFVRVFIGAVIVTAIALMGHLKLPKLLANWGFLLLIALFSNVIPFSLIGWASISTDSATVSILMATSPIFALVFSHFFTSDDRFTVFKCFSVVLGFAAVLTLSLPTGDMAEGDLMAKAATLMAAMSYVIAGLLTRRLTENLGVPSITSIVLFLSAVLLAPFAISEGFSAIDQYSTNTLFSIVYLGVFSTAMALLIRYSLILQVGYTFVSFVGFLVPVFAVVFGAVLLGERLSANAYFSLVLVLLALAVSRVDSNVIKRYYNK